MAIFDFFQSDIRGVNAPDFPEGLKWFNSPHLTLKELRSKVVLIDFWTYSCINCQRTIPVLRQWWEKYGQSPSSSKDHGLVVIGVHSPEFEFEKEPKNVQAAIKKYGVNWPVVLDNDHQIWNSYANHYWPAEYLLNASGKIVYIHFGEGNYLETELEIQRALRDAGFKFSEKLSSQLSPEAGGQFGQTPELYCGYLRGVLGNGTGYTKDIDFFYDTSGLNEQFKPDLIYLQGLWKAMPQFIEHSRDTKKLEDLVILSYRAKKVYLVMESANGGPIKVYVTLDGIGLAPGSAGSDIKFDQEKRSYTEVRFPTLYNLVDSESFGDHIIRISTLSKGLRCYAFTFGS